MEETELLQVVLEILFVELRFQQEGIMPLGGFNALIAGIHSVLEQPAVEAGDIAG
jgi:hypothetical protein